MNKYLFLSALFLAGLILPPYAHPQNPFVIGYNQDLVPSFYWKDKDKNEGIDAEIIQELFNRSHLTYEIRFLPWKRLMHMLKYAEMEMACPGFKTTERETFAIYLEKPLNYAVFSVFVRKGEVFSFNGLEDLHGKKIGINRGYSISPQINDQKHRGRIIIEETDSAENNLKKLIAKRIDAYAGNRDAVLYTALSLGISDQITYLPHPITDPRPVYFMISKAVAMKNKNSTIQNLNQHLDEMWQDGTIERMIFKYINLESYTGK